MEELLRITERVKRSNKAVGAERYIALTMQLLKAGWVVIGYSNSKPCTGRAFGVMELADRFRISLKAGYGRYNYAPCIEIAKVKFNEFNK